MTGDVESDPMRMAFESGREAEREDLVSHLMQMRLDAMKKRSDCGEYQEEHALNGFIDAINAAIEWLESR